MVTLSFPVRGQKMCLMHCRKKNIDAVLSDVRMPEMSGIELLEKIHAHKFPFGPSLPQIVNKIW